MTPVSGTPLCGAPQIPLDWQGQLAALPSTLGCWDVRATWEDGRDSVGKKNRLLSTLFELSPRGRLVCRVG